jgi:hypothetical protein
MQPNNTAALRKRTQITKANRTMFLWIAASAALIGCALVVSFFLAQKLFYNEKVLAEKEKTISVLKANNEVVDELESQVKALDASEVLTSAKAKEGDQAIEANSLAVGASLQNKLLAGIEGLRIESLQVDPVLGVESLATDATSEDASAGIDTSNQITFQFAVSGSTTALKAVLTNLERSIRAIDVTSLRIEYQADNKQLMTVQGRTFYEPAKTIQLYDKVVKP